MRVVMAILCLLSVSCATVGRGRHESIQVRSEPSGATVLADCGSARQPVPTPAEIRVLRKAAHCVIRLEKDGYEPAEVALQRKRGGLFWGNMAIGGLGTVGVTIALAPVLVWTGGSVGPIPFLLIAGSGIAIDYATGAVWEHIPREVDVELTPLRD